MNALRVSVQWYRDELELVAQIQKALGPVEQLLLAGKVTQEELDKFKRALVAAEGMAERRREELFAHPGTHPQALRRRVDEFQRAHDLYSIAVKHQHAEPLWANQTRSLEALSLACKLMVAARERMLLLVRKNKGTPS